MADERDHRRGRHRDHARVRTPPGGVSVSVPLEAIDDASDLTPPPWLLKDLMADVTEQVSLTPREQLMIAAVAEKLLSRIDKMHGRSTDRMLAIQAESQAPASNRTNVRLAQLETGLTDLTKWRLALTGVADGNGRMGQLMRDIDSLREDVGDGAECKTVRAAARDVHAFKRRSWAAILFAASAVGASGWGLVKSRDENIAAAARASERLDVIQRDLERNRADIREIRFPHLPPLAVPIPRSDP